MISLAPSELSLGCRLSVVSSFPFRTDVLMTACFRPNPGKRAERYELLQAGICGAPSHPRCSFARSRCHHHLIPSDVPRKLLIVKNVAEFVQKRGRGSHLAAPFASPAIPISLHARSRYRIDGPRGREHERGPVTLLWGNQRHRGFGEAKWKSVVQHTRGRCTRVCHHEHRVLEPLSTSWRCARAP